MPAQIVIVLNQLAFAETTAQQLGGRGWDATVIPDPMVAIDLLEAPERIELLLTCFEFGTNKPNGISLARMARMKSPGIKVLFVGEKGFEQHTAGVGEFIAAPVTVPSVVQRIVEMLGG